MTTLIIKQQMAGTGCITDIQSQYHDIKIDFPIGTHFAVVTAAYYGGNPVEGFYKKLDEAVEASFKCDYVHRIIKSDGKCYSAGHHGVTPDPFNDGVIQVINAN